MNKNKKLISRLVFLAAFGAVIFGVVWMGQNLSKSQNSSTVVSEFMPGQDGKTVVVEFSDFQCPACKYYRPLTNQLTAEFGDQIVFDYKHFPLKSIHKNAELASRASEAARLQNAFDRMADVLFEKQELWANADDAEQLFVSYASSLGLDTGKFSDDYSSDAVKDKVNDDYQRGIQLGIRGTPTFFVNGKKISNPANYNEFQSIIRQAIGQ